MYLVLASGKAYITHMSNSSPLTLFTNNIGRKKEIERKKESVQANVCESTVYYHIERFLKEFPGPTSNVSGAVSLGAEVYSCMVPPMNSWQV